MPSSKADTRHITEGRYEDVIRERLVYGDAASHRVRSTFVKMVVLDVISDPFTLDTTKLDHYANSLGVSNIAFAAVAPRNSIIARPVMKKGAGAHEKVMVLYPFFPPHLSFPAKAGEQVWAIFENPEAKVDEIGYWMCRVVQPHFVDDMNHTHADRQADPSFMPGLGDVFSGHDDPVYEFRNGAVDSRDGARYVVGGTNSLPGDENAYDLLLTQSDASKITKYESVPRYRKRPADVTLEGSNNTLLVLGTDRTGAAAEYIRDPETGQVPRPPSSDVFDVGAGSIDIVVGRGQTSETAGSVAKNSTVRGAALNTELGKSTKELSPKEGDVDMINDRSRILISQKTRADSAFKLTNVTKANGVNNDEAEGAIVIKSDRLRLVARHDIVILVNGANSKDENGNVKDPGDLDVTRCASITIKSNGDIVFTPAIQGVIKLGGDDASLAVLCARAITGAGDGTGAVTAAPIVDTMGGTEGSGGPAGQFATKILLK